MRKQHNIHPVEGINPCIQNLARQALSRQDFETLPRDVPGHEAMAYVHANWAVLRRYQALEQCFVIAYSMHADRRDLVRDILDVCDAARLQDAGDPLPDLDGAAAHVVFRGSSNREGLRGFSWSSDIGVALDFAGDNGYVARMELLPLDVAFYTNVRGEHEFVVDTFCMPNFETILVNGEMVS